MTGFGDARRQTGVSSISVEVRTVNNRFLKCSVRLPESCSTYEAEVEKLIRAAVARGTVHLTVRLDRISDTGRYSLDANVLAGFAEQVRAVSTQLGLPLTGLDPLLSLPGVITERESQSQDPTELWPIIQPGIVEALQKLDTFRRSEGSAMADELRANIGLIERELDAVAEQAPIVVREYRDRMQERVTELLRGAEATVSDADLIREVSMFADRSDINEEITRLRSHLDQFRAFLDDEQSQGRKLDFLTQELFREVNTIGSKANNVAIAHRVVEMKAAVEKIREILQNIE